MQRRDSLSRNPIPSRQRHPPGRWQRLLLARSGEKGGGDLVAVMGRVAPRSLQRPDSFEPEMEVVLERVADGAVALEGDAGGEAGGLVGGDLGERGVAGQGRLGGGDRPGGAGDRPAGVLEGDEGVGQVVFDPAGRSRRAPNWRRCFTSPAVVSIRWAASPHRTAAVAAAPRARKRPASTPGREWRWTR